MKFEARKLFPGFGDGISDDIFDWKSDLLKIYDLFIDLEESNPKSCDLRFIIGIKTDHNIDLCGEIEDGEIEEYKSLDNELKFGKKFIIRVSINFHNGHSPFGYNSYFGDNYNKFLEIMKFINSIKIKIPTYYTSSIKILDDGEIEFYLLKEKN